MNRIENTCNSIHMFIIPPTCTPTQPVCTSAVVLSIVLYSDVWLETGPQPVTEWGSLSCVL